MKEQIVQIIEDAGYGTLATCENGQPRVRPMSFVISEQGTLLSSTYNISGKIAEFNKNCLAEVCFVDGSKTHLRVEGVIDISGGVEKKRQLLKINPKVRRHFSNENDPKFVHIEITPKVSKWKAPGFNEYQVYEGTY